MKALLARFNALAPRLRIGITLALMAVVYLAFDATLLGSLEKRHKALKAEIGKTETELTTVRAEVLVVKAELDKDPHAKDRAQLDAYKKAMDETDTFISKVESDPSQVGALLRQILGSTPGLTLVSLKTLPATQVIAGKTDPKAPAKADANASGESRALYRRGIEVTVRGNYLAMLPYLDKLQNLPTRVLWSDADLTTQTYPESPLRLTIYTLSTQSGGSLG